MSEQTSDLTHAPQAIQHALADLPILFEAVRGDKAAVSLKGDVIIEIHLQDDVYQYAVRHPEAAQLDLAQERDVIVAGSTDEASLRSAVRGALQQAVISLSSARKAREVQPEQQAAQLPRTTSPKQLPDTAPKDRSSQAILMSSDRWLVEGVLALNLRRARPYKPAPQLAGMTVQLKSEFRIDIKQDEDACEFQICHPEAATLGLQWKLYGFIVPPLKQYDAITPPVRVHKEQFAQVIAQHVETCTQRVADARVALAEAKAAAEAKAQEEERLALEKAKIRPTLEPLADGP